MTALRTRLATPADAAAITAIYNEGIADRVHVRDRAATVAQIAQQLTDG
jgi:L-amino acid N-acyltransferase YncA